MQRVTVSEASTRLGISKDAVRARIKRGTLDSERDADGNVFVLLLDDVADGDQDGDQGTDQPTVILLDYVETLKERIRHLEEESSRKDTIIMSLTQRIPELEAPRETSSETQRSPETASEESYGTSPQEAEDSLHRRERSWWQRWFGLE